LTVGDDGRAPHAAVGCPVNAATQLWTESSLRWLGSEFGSRQLRQDVVLPNARFIPPGYAATGPEIERLVALACLHMQVDRQTIDLRLFDGSEEKQAAARTGRSRAVGHFQVEDGRFVVSLDLSESADAVMLLAIVAHELGHVRLLGERRIGSERRDHERLTDLLTVFFGFGIFTTNAAMRFDRGARGFWIQPTEKYDDRTLNAASNSGYQRLGYLTSGEFGYALGCFSWLRGESDPAWARFVNPGPLAEMRKSLTYLKGVSKPGELPSQRVLNPAATVGNAASVGSAIGRGPAGFTIPVPRQSAEAARQDPECSR
jgi:hypothetical protein